MYKSFNHEAKNRVYSQPYSFPFQKLVSALIQPDIQRIQDLLKKSVNQKFNALRLSCLIPELKMWFRLPD